MISFIKEGSGKKTLVLLHGWAKKKEDYQELVGLLAKKYTVYSLDLPGFGATPMTRSYNLADYAKDVAGFVNGKRLEKVILLGHSFGGRVAIKMALEYPKLVEKLVLVDSAGIERKSVRVEVLRLLWTLAPLAPTRLRELLRPMVGSKDYLESIGWVRETFKNVVGENLEPELAKIKIPTLLVWGENDHTTPLWQGKVMQREISGSKLVIISGTDHGAPYRKAKEVADAIFDN